MGLRQDLQLKGNDFTNIATAFFVAFIVAEMPNGKLPLFTSVSHPDSGLTEQYIYYNVLRQQSGSG